MPGTPAFIRALIHRGDAPIVKWCCSQWQCRPRLSYRLVRNGHRKRQTRGRPPWPSSDAPICQVLSDCGCAAIPIHGGTGGADARTQDTVDLPGDVPFQAPHDLPPGFALRRAPGDVAAGALVDAHAHDTDKVQGAVGVSVAPAALRRCLNTLPEEASMGEIPHRLAKEASLPNLWGLSPATTNSVAALSVPMPGKATNSGAACATSRSRCASSSVISSERASWRRATERSANLVAVGTSRGSSPRRKRAATETSSFVESPRRRSRSSSGAVTRKPCSWG